MNNEFNSLILEDSLYRNLSHDLFDVYLILIHKFLNNEFENIKINADEILSFRGIKKIRQGKFKRSGYKKPLKEKIADVLCGLNELNLISILNHNNYNFEIKMNENYLKGPKIKLPKKLLNFNPSKNSWHKDIGYFLSVYKFKKPKSKIIQVQKIMKEIKNNYHFLQPSEIRNRFENVMDELSQANIIQNWYYKNIDEEFLNCKNWIWWWKKLSVKIDYDILSLQPCFLNF